MARRLLLLWALASVSVMTGHVSGAAAAGPTHWVWQNPQPDGNFLFSIACGGRHHCVAVGMGGRVMVTANDGRSWTRHDIDTHPSLGRLSCPTARVCLAVSYFESRPNVTPVSSIVRTDDGGLTWRMIQAAPTKYMSSLSCPSPQVCFLVGYQTETIPGIWWTGDSGQTWSAVWSAQPGQRWPSSITCQTVMVCFAFGDVGLIMVTRDSGKLWRVLAPHVRQYSILGMSCPSTTTCYASATSSQGDGDFLRTHAIARQVGPASTILRTTDGGKHWKHVLDVNDQLGAVMCPSGRVCYVPGTRVLVTHDAGRTWRHLNPPHQSAALACPTVTVCHSLAGIQIDSTRDKGLHWTSTPGHFAFEQGLDSIACPSEAVCYAAGYRGIVGTKDGGTTWTSLVDDGNEVLTDIACGTPSDCVSVGSLSGVGVTETTHDAGRTWHAAALLDIPDVPAHVACPSAARCYIVGSANDVSSGLAQPTALLLISMDAGRSWKQSSALPAALQPVAPSPAGASPNFAALAIACPTESVCYVPSVANQTSTVAVTHDSGSTWKVGPSPQGAGHTIACPTVTRCFIVGSGATSPTPAISLTDDGGASWLSYPDTAVPPLQGVACGSATSCVAISAYGYGWIFGTADGGETWSQQDSPDGVGLTAVACPSANTCYAVGGEAILKTS